MDSRLDEKYMSLDDNDIDALSSDNVSSLELGSNSQYLESLAELALNPRWTSIIFAAYEPLFVDICNRWISKETSQRDPLDVAAALARILPLAAHLSIYAEEVIFRRPGGAYDVFLSQSFMGLSQIPEVRLMSLLLCLTRLLEFDNETFASAVSPVKLQLLLCHPHHAVRYLAVKLLCLYLHAQDATFVETISRHTGGEDKISGLWDDNVIDYNFYALWEEKRLSDLRIKLSEYQRRFHYRQGELPACRAILPEDLSSSTIYLAGLLFVGQQTKSLSSLVMTRSTKHNVHQVANALLDSRAVLVTGPSGSSKSSVIRDIARILGKESTALTLHLNEQTDARLLIGLYTSGAPGSFTWRPGILTTAVREGRFVIVEDLDRAPAEVTSVLLPLLERGELLVPNLGGTLRASSGFKLIATIRSKANTKPNDVLPGINLLGLRHWHHVSLQPLSDLDIEEIICSKYPILTSHRAMIMSVYRTLKDQHLTKYSKFRASQQSSNHATLFRCCSRLESLLLDTGIGTGNENITEGTYDNMFLEIVDSFGASAQSKEARDYVAALIAKEMHIPIERAEYVTQARIPTYIDSETSLQIGRATLPKRKQSEVAWRSNRQGKRRPFAITRHTARICESLLVAIKMKEPCLLVGETATGKTSIVQQLADSLGHKLVVVNLSQQSEAGDLLGGFKPINTRTLAMPIKENFDDLFGLMFTSPKNQRYLKSVARAVAKSEWNRALTLWMEALKMVESTFSSPSPILVGQASSQPKKRRKIDTPNLQNLKGRWDSLAAQVRTFEKHVSSGMKGFAFSFVEGNIVKAVRNGDWVLLDEINLASADTLESLADLLSTEPNGKPFLLLSETGDVQKIEAHSEFRLFGAMNPATDVGKKELPVSLRSRFTEYYIESLDNDLECLVQVINVYLGPYSHTDIRGAQDIARLYLEIRRLQESNQLVDGAGQKACFSLRTLTRTMTYIVDIAPIYGFRRAVFEGFAMSFLTLLNKDSELLILSLIEKHILGSLTNHRAIMNQLPQSPANEKEYVRFKHYWMVKGPSAVQQQPNYIITPFIERNLLNLVRATSTRRFPVLLQGPTSSGKTSLIEFLAKISGNVFVRVNNHEHTDIQEYLGAYVSGPSGQLYYQEGVLVRALREGHWIVLDELNLAPSDILEALNRLLDDNRELLLPETQEVVRPHENFMLFATQNPPGLYGGRKVLSRAFRNRFLELHFDEIPEDELETILRERSQIAPSFCTRIVAVYKRLAILRQSGRLFEQSHSFATLRDLFRWALRSADDKEQLAINGFMLLAERVRDSRERHVVKKTIEGVMKVKINEAHLYSNQRLSLQDQSLKMSSNIVWTESMRRLYFLITEALKNKEPVLLVGETGIGKTSICQLIAEVMHTPLHIVNAHQNTETGDIIGAQRPTRNRSAAEAQLIEILSNVILDYTVLNIKNELPALLEAYQSLPSNSLKNIPQELRQQIDENIVKMSSLFEWSDGNLVYAMKNGHHFMLDEISLADDSVLERLNSVLEPARTLLLAEKGTDDIAVIATSDFQFLATMNPSGDYGKKELSPALRNRFTEIWAGPLSDDDVLQIAQTKLTPSLSSFAKPIFEFSKWYAAIYRDSSSISLREVLSWTKFMNLNQSHGPHFSLLHGAALTYIDSLGANPAGKLSTSFQTVQKQRQMCLEKLSQLAGLNLSSLYYEKSTVSICDRHLKIGHFQIERDTNGSIEGGFSLAAATTSNNAMRIIRALQLRKPILIEGIPGVGKTSVVVALANAIGMPLTRLNLSEQTDIMDLFGSDIPVDGGHVGQFAWRDAPFLKAMKKGEWVLLDEMNLASQSVLEGLNACLDHRGQVYVPELDQTFSSHPNFIVFAAQNPHHHGGGRKGLPASFVNRFTVVYADIFTADDLLTICQQLYPDLVSDQVTHLIEWVMGLSRTTLKDGNDKADGGPWEFNLRDILRWLQLLTSQELLMPAAAPADYHSLLFFQRLRSLDIREKLITSQGPRLSSAGSPHSLFHNLSQLSYQVGRGLILRQSNPTLNRQLTSTSFSLDLQLLESIVLCVQHQWPCLLVGPPASGKSRLIYHLASNVAANLVEFPMNSEMDTMDLIGGYEQVDANRHILLAIEQLRALLEDAARRSLMTTADIAEVIGLVEQLRSIDVQDHQKLQFILRTLRSASTLSGFPSILEKCEALASVSSLESGENRIRFEWADGVLVEALKKGQWLVLDNANICNSSVLDRLNSLLEPNGVLAINEHRLLDGSVEIVRPHPSFRLFLTMDPRHGELSRSMRNRCIELFIPKYATLPNSKVSRASLESSMFRYKSFQCIDWKSFDEGSFRALATVCFDHLAFSDFQNIRLWYEQVENGLLQIHSSYIPVFFSILDTYVRMFDSKKIVLIKILELYRALASKPSFPQDYYYAQSIHPLNNPIFLRLLPEVQNRPITLARFLEVMIDLEVLGNSFDNIRHSLPSRQAIQLSRLERSMASSWSLEFSKEPTQPLAEFIDSMRQALLDWIEAQALNDRNEIDTVFEEMTWYLRDIFDLAQMSSFNEAIFQVYLTLGRELSLRNHGAASSCALGNILAMNLDRFKPSWALLTGTSMEILWHPLKPKTASSVSHLNQALWIEKLANRFDNALWRSGASINQIVSLRITLTAAYVHEESQHYKADSDLRDLEIALSEAESLVDSSVSNSPHFTFEFEGLRQYLSTSLTNTPDKMVEIDVLAGRASALCFGRGSDTYELLVQIARFTGIDQPQSSLMTIGNRFPISMFVTLKNLANVPLHSLDRVCQELRILASITADVSQQILRNQYHTLNSYLSRMIIAVLESHEFLFQPQPLIRCLEYLKGYPIVELYESVPKLQFSPSKSTTLSPSLENFQEVFRSHLEPAIYNIHKAAEEEVHQQFYSGIAWIQTFLGCLKLYVPNRQFDPALRPVVECERHVRRKMELQDKLKALRYYQETFHGQQPSLRSELVQKTIDVLGSPPQVQAVLRPEISDLGGLQEEFSNVLRSIVNQCPDPESILVGSRSTKDDLQLIRRNILQVTSRLMNSYRAYDDIGKPVVGLLRGLDVGMALVVMRSTNDLEDKNIKLISRLCKMTPFIGLVPKELNQMTFEDLSDWSESNCQISLIHLKLGTLMCRIQPQVKGTISTTMHKIFHKFFHEWKQRLEEDQSENNIKSGLYRYRGRKEDSEEVDEQDFLELFPDFESDHKKISIERIKHERSPKELACLLADHQHDFYSAVQNPKDLMLGLIENTTDQIATQWASMDSSQVSIPIRAEETFPSAVIYLRSCFHHMLHAPSVDRSYNFYTDANLVEAQKLVVLLKRVQSRFREINFVWPEHVIPVDILRICIELLAYPNIESLAKIINKTEQLHSYVHEWQVIASRQYAVTNLYDNLTNLIISWRRIELGTWARLLDMEDEACRIDARSWWFIAYEVIVSAPLSIVASDGDLHKHVCELLATLENFLQTTAIGQYSHRLLLINQFKHHMKFMLEDEPLLQPVYTALANFVSFYSKYEPYVQDNIQKGRQTLEKEMKEILLLASWKDTNINALRESSNRSHHKLFRVIRKYRTILSQASGSILNQGLPQDSSTLLVDAARIEQSTYRDPILHIKLQVASINRSAIQDCIDALPNWTEISTRLTRPDVTTTIMIRESSLPANTVDYSLYVESFSSNLSNTINVLRKETPSSLTDDNKDAVKYMKSRKRKLFSDTLKEIRIMGFHSNVAKDVLSKQATLSTVLATTPALPRIDFGFKDDIVGAEDFFHVALNEILTTRSSLGQQFGDLTAVDVSRSMGYLEGVLSILLKQRTVLRAALTDIGYLDGCLAKMQSLWAPNNYTLLKSTQLDRVLYNSIEQRLRWLPGILDTCGSIIEMYDGLGTHDSSMILEGLAGWREKFIALIDSFEKIPALPPGLCTSSHSMACKNTGDVQREFMIYINRVQQEYPEISFAIRMMEPWAIPEEAIQAAEVIEVQKIDIYSFTEQLSKTVDSTLVALEGWKKIQLNRQSSCNKDGWLVDAEVLLAEDLKALKAKQVTRKLEDTLSQLQCIHVKERELQTAAALCATALPILQQYRNIFRNTVSQYAKFHSSLCRMACILATSFKEIVTHGFCSPSEKSESKEGKEEIEGGTGLGEGEGADDISKDIQEDENLDELAQNGTADKDREEIEEHEDAIDMEQEEMEGEIGSEVGEKDDGQEDATSNATDDEMDEETEEVDDLDPSAIDEKMWEGQGNDNGNGKDKTIDNVKGEKQEEMAAQNDANELQGEQEEANEEEVKESEEVAQLETENIDPHLEDGQNLELPEEIDLNSEKAELDSDSDGMDDLSDVDHKDSHQDGTQDETREDTIEETCDEHPDAAQSPETEDEPEDEKEKPENAGSPVDTEPGEVTQADDPGLLTDPSKDTANDADNATPSDVQGSGEDFSPPNDAQDAHKGDSQNNTGLGPTSTMPVDALSNPKHGGPSDTLGTIDVSEVEDDKLQGNIENHVFKKLGDALEKWHRQRNQILSPADNGQPDDGIPRNTDQSGQGFEHLPNDDSTADTQALGAATEDQARALTPQQDSEMADLPQDFLPNESNEQSQDVLDQLMEDIESRERDSENHTEQSRLGAVIGNDARGLEAEKMNGMIDDNEDDKDDLDMELSRVHIESEQGDLPRSPSEAHRLWSYYENRTRNLSLSLTEQLRLILAPTLASKMRGDFRTGKRLNIKRIIPFIASQYKRDKIWMRRSVPSKRSYQVMLAIDDSKSMGENGSGQLAFETLALISKSLNMLEVGQICIVSFGNDVQVPHSFDQPFSSEAGANALRYFGFQQTMTNVGNLIAKSIDLFRHAKANSPNSAVDLWQLELIISDGVCEDHECIRRLVRQAQEERIMIIFVIVDGLKNESILNMTQAIFKPDGNGETKLKIKRYLEDFPFGYYLIVEDVKDLPRVLATALRQWFAEVVDSG